MRAYQLWQEARKHFAGGTKRHPEVAVVAKDLALADVSLTSFSPQSIASGWTSAPLTMTSSMVAVTGLRMPQKVSRSRSRKKQGQPAHWTSTYMSSWTPSWTSKMAALSQHFIELCSLLTSPHLAITCGQTGCGKTVFALNLLEGHYRGVFHHVVILCPTIKHKKTYQNRPWIWADPEVYVIDPGERLHDCLRAMYQVFQGEPTLYIIDDCNASKALTKKKDMLSELAFSGRHAGASVWVLTQKYNAVLKDLREQIRWVAMFHCKDQDSVKDALCENDVIPSHEEKTAVRQLLAETRHGKLLLKTDQPAEYHVLCWVKLCWA